MRLSASSGSEKSGRKEKCELDGPLEDSSWSYLDGLPKAHFIAKNDILPRAPLVEEPVESFELVGMKSAPMEEIGGLGELPGPLTPVAVWVNMRRDIGQS
jgi:hypothetical protein